MAVRKTVKQRAQEQLDLSERILERAEKRSTTADKDLEEARARYVTLTKVKEEEAAAARTALTEAQGRVEFNASNPALTGEELL